MKPILKLLAISRCLPGLLILSTGMCPSHAQTATVTTWVPAGETSTPRPDYSKQQYWMMTPQNPNAHPVDVLFFHTTTFWDPNYVDPATGAHLPAARDSTLPPVWNQTIGAAIQEGGAAAISNSQVSVFAASCNIYVPYYRQTALPEALMADPAAAERALSVAYTDIEAAFDYYMAHFNNGRPFILAGHSQGSNLLLWLLERRLDNPAYMQKLVAAYVIGWAVTQDDLDRYSQLEMCNSATQTGCIVSYNSQGPLATSSMARPGAVGVNPLLKLWSTSTDIAPASLNMGTVLMPPVVATQTELPHFTGAYNLNGALILTDPPQGAPMANAAQVYHAFDYALFYRNLEQNAKDRIAAFRSRKPLARHPLSQ
jgi:pimeloyl-ACP methyl ester carboxylesterase